MNLKKLKHERWKQVTINGKVTRYWISDKGRISNGKKIMKSFSIKNEYISCTLRMDNVSYATRVHRLVAQAFIPNPNNLPQINHKDGVKWNNDASNLEWCTSKQNIVHSFELGLCIRPKGNNSHLYDKGRKVVHEATGKIYSSVATAAREFKIPRTTISAEINGYRPNKYGFKYYE